MALNNPGFGIDNDNNNNRVVGTKFMPDEDYYIAQAWLKTLTSPILGTAWKSLTFLNRYMIITDPS